MKLEAPGSIQHLGWQPPTPWTGGEMLYVVVWQYRCPRTGERYAYTNTALESEFTGPNDVERELIEVINDSYRNNCLFPWQADFERRKALDREWLNSSDSTQRTH